jgi:flagellar hook-associated protein 2
MAVSSSTSATGSSLDVASIVSQLMEVESKPLTKLDSKISASTVKISKLGVFKANLSSLQGALNDLQTPANFSAWSAKLSNDSVASAELATTASAGSYQLGVTQLARPTIWNVSGFTTEAAALSWYNDAGQTSLRNSADATVLKSATGQYVLTLKAKSTGTAAGFSISNSALTGVLSATEYQAALDAQFNLNGVSFTRASNTVADTLTGVTLNLKAVTVTNSPVTLTVAQAESSAKPKLDALVKAYNDLQTFYKTETQASAVASTRGVLNSDFAVGSMMREILTGLMLPMTGVSGAALTGQTDLSAFGLKLQDNGQLAVDTTLLANATTLQSRLASGITIGFDTVSGKDLSTRISAMFTSGGMLQERINNEQKVQQDLNTRKTTLQEKLATIQVRYTAQYAALDALLFKLQSTSTSLKSALDGLTASQKNN